MATIIVEIPDQDLPDAAAGMAQRLGETAPAVGSEQIAVSERYLTRCAQDAWGQYRAQAASDAKRVEDAENPWLHEPQPSDRNA